MPAQHSESLYLLHYTPHMPTSSSTADFLTGQMSGAGNIRNRKMFGEYALYCNDKVVALLCDEKLFVKPTAVGKAFLGNAEEAPPYPGAKLHYLIEEDRWEDREWLSELITKTAAALPAPKPKKRKE